MSYRYIFNVKLLKSSRRLKQLIVNGDKIRAFQRKLFLFQGANRMETANLADIPMFMYFLYESDKRTPAGTQSNIMQNF
jgi:hypothetical protein